MSHMLLVASLAVFAAACACPALDFRVFSGDPADYRIVTDRGFTLLLMGWLGFFAGQFAWLANPLWLAAVVAGFYGRDSWSLGLSAAALLAALLSLQLRRKAIPRDEGGVMQGLLHRPRVGFYLWLAAMGLAAAAALVRFI